MTASVLALVALLALPRVALAVSDGVSDIYNPFTIESARAAGMGRIVSVAGDGSTATWWNPAGLAMDPERRLTLSSADLAPFLDGDYVRSVTLSGPLSPRSSGLAFGVGFKRLDRGGFDILNVSGETIGTSESFDHHFIASVGVPLGSSWSAGVSIEYLWSHLADPIPELNISDGAGGAVSASLGLAYERSMRFASESGASGELVLSPLAGASLLHLGQKLDYGDGDAEDLWRQFRTAVGLKAAFVPASGTPAIDRARLRQFEFVTALEAYVPVLELDAITQESVILHFGAEMSLFGVLTGRIGFIDDDESSMVSRDNTYGVGLSLPDGLPVDVRFDWASIPIAATQRIERRSLSITLRGGGS